MLNEIRFNENRKFGVEIEFYVDDEGEVRRKMRNKGLDVWYESYNHQTKTHWKLTTDSSCEYELVSPPLKGIEGLEEVRKAVEALNEAGAKIDTCCGLHVHHDAADFTVETFKNLYIFYIRYEDTIDELMDKDRRASNNHFCRTLRKYYFMTTEGLVTRIRTVKHINELVNRIYDNRYIKLNCQAYVRHGTIEFRQHEGTLDYEGIKSWIILTNLMVEKAQRGFISSVRTQQKWTSFKNTICAYEHLGATEMVREMAKYFDKKRKMLAVA